MLLRSPLAACLAVEQHRHAISQACERTQQRMWLLWCALLFCCPQDGHAAPGAPTSRQNRLRALSLALHGKVILVKLSEFWSADS